MGDLVMVDVSVINGAAPVVKPVGVGSGPENMLPICPSTRVYFPEPKLPFVPSGSRKSSVLELR